MLKTIAGVVVVLIAAVLLFAATKPDTFTVQRATSIEASPETIFALISDFHRWDAWWPYEERDPAMKRNFSGPASGKGAVYEWEGSREVGQGRMVMTDISPPSKVSIQLDFMKPFEAHNIAEFTMDAKSDATEVTWAMHGDNTYIGNVVQVFFNMDDMIGKDFEARLANLKRVAEQ